uniref:Wadjet protein JetD C-terminal domain-containing protein n=1 Tax=uncultured Thiotrichaceae bacterium TaxID=298394 RepID=A0A6S6U641_9GAMM|nr:MAG: FIG005429: hypothetical protein [uncultured Thiotrichaceae bacterium]
MITPADIRQKAQKLWDNGKLLQDVLSENTLFPWEITFRTPNARQQLEDFAAIRLWAEQLKSQSQEVANQGYSIEYKSISHRQLGEQRLPKRIVFSQRDDLLRYLRKQREFGHLLALMQGSISSHPDLHHWFLNKPRQFMQYANVWPELLAVCDHLMAHPRPDCYVRELDIVGVDSKFIEQHRGILAELLDALLPEDVIDNTVTGVSHYGFERRYGLKYPEPLVRLRLLDAALYPVGGVSDVSLPVSQLAQWSIPCERVFITENKINGLSFPEQVNSLVIFGLGYGVDVLAGVEWLRDKAIVYWGDIDTHGFSILSRLRSHFPEVRSLMMDHATVEQFSNLCVEEPENARCVDVLRYLTDEEQVLYQQLQRSYQRLEQERLPMGYVVSCVESTEAM